MMPQDAADTIAAISTPLGEAGIGIVRLSGPGAEVIATALFRPRRPRPRFLSHHLYLGHIIAPSGEIIDEVLLTIMRGPQTYTREDVVEIHCHSGWGVLRRILELTLAQGARAARPGEFTLRAFLSGRIDLTQAEAVLEVIQARTAAGASITFQGYGEELFLAPALPREFLQLPPPPALQKPKPEKPRPPAPTPGTFILDLPLILQGPPQSRSKVKGEPSWKSGARALRRKRGLREEK